MFEKVTPMHPDKVADRIAGAIVDMAYRDKENPRISVEVLMGYGDCNIIIKTDCNLSRYCIHNIVRRISGCDGVKLNLKIIRQTPGSDGEENTHCDDNGIFKGFPTNTEQRLVVKSLRCSYVENQSSEKLTSNGYCGIGRACTDIFNSVGATNRKLGSDMGDSMTGGGIHGKDLAKPDVSIAIYAWLKAQKENKPVQLSCTIGDEKVDGIPYSEIVETARKFIQEKGGFEKFAEWGLID